MRPCHAWHIALLLWRATSPTSFAFGPWRGVWMLLPSYPVDKLCLGTINRHLQRRSS